MSFLTVFLLQRVVYISHHAFTELDDGKFESGNPCSVVSSENQPVSGVDVCFNQSVDFLHTDKP